MRRKEKEKEEEDKSNILSMYFRLSSATLSHLAFSRRRDPNFPWEKIPIGQYSCGKEKKKTRKRRMTMPHG